MTLSKLSPDGKAALEVVKTLLASLTLKDINLFNSTLDPKGLFVNVRHATRNTVLYNSTNGGIQKYLDVIWHSDKKFEECIDENRELVVLVDDDIATVWTPFWVRWDGVLSHVGTNSFGLAKIKHEAQQDEPLKGNVSDANRNWDWKIVTMHDNGRPATEQEVSRL